MLSKFWTGPELSHCHILGAILRIDQTLVLGSQDFFQKDCWKHHPKPYQEFVDWRLKEDAKIESYRNSGAPAL